MTVLRWAGSKKQLVKSVVEAMQEAAPFWRPEDGYYEPFFGGGFVFFALAKHAQTRNLDKPWAWLSDGNAALMNFWMQAGRQSAALLVETDALFSGYMACAGEEEKAEYFRACRRMFNVGLKLCGGAGPKQAALFFFLNRTCFNGLYRTNQKGEYNVPFGKIARPKRLTTEKANEINTALSDAWMRTGSYETALPTPGSLLYLDPPYPETFTAYDGVPWSEGAHVALAEWADRQRRNGVKVIVSQPDCELSRRLYAGWDSVSVSARRSIAAAGGKRGRAQELIFFRKAAV